jgi:serine/threonine-protein kinase
VPGWEATLARVAEPRPFLGAKALWSFPTTTVPVPVLLARAGLAMPGARDADTPQFKELYLHKLKPDPRGAESDPSDPWPPGGPAELVFDADAPDWHGDLGAFLRERVKPGTPRARVRVIGSGPRRFSPVRLPDAIALEIRVDPPSSQGAEWLSWSPDPESPASSLIELHGGTLVLSRVRLHEDGGASLKTMIHVEGGDLVLHRCLLTARLAAGAGLERLISFRAASTGPRDEPPAGIFAFPPDRHVCIIGDSTLIAPGSAILATVGRGLIALSQTAVAATGDAIELVPAQVARDRFAADLVLENCTLASETNIVRLRSWQGRAPGPDRPWLIQSLRCAFLGTYDRRASDTVLFRSDPDALPRGLALWQGVGDAIEVDRFAALEDTAASVRYRDVQLQWANLWGANHQRDLTGPRAGSIIPSVRLFERLKLGRVEPQDLCLDPGYHPYRAMLDAGADLSRQGILPRQLSGARRR